MTNNLKYIVLVFTAISILQFTSCSHKHGENHDEEHETEQNHDHDSHSNHNDLSINESVGDENKMNEEKNEREIHLTSKQIETIGLEFGDFTEIKVNDFIKATGTLGIPPSAYASVSAKSQGLIKGTKKYVEGNFIKKNEILAYIENPDFIKIQQEYLEVKAQLEYKLQDLARQQTLIDEDAGVIKKLEKVKSDVAILKSKERGKKKHLEYLGISTVNLTPETIKEVIPVISPMSGFITNINLHNGMYVQPTIPLMEIVSDDHLHLELDVFEKDVSKINLNQKITYNIPALGLKQYEGIVSIIGKEFHRDTKTLRIHGHLEGEKPLFLKDLFIEARIWLNDNTAKGIPEASVIIDGPISYIYVAKEIPNQEETEFKKISVIPGQTNNGYMAINLLETIPVGMKIVTEGAYYIYAQSKVGEMEHHH